MMLTEKERNKQEHKENGKDKQRKIAFGEKRGRGKIT